MLLIDEDVSVLCFARAHVHDNIIGIGHWPLNDPGLDAFVLRELEHLPRLVG